MSNITTVLDHAGSVPEADSNAHTAMTASMPVGVVVIVTRPAHRRASVIITAACGQSGCVCDCYGCHSGNNHCDNCATGCHLSC